MTRNELNAHRVIERLKFINIFVHPASLHRVTGKIRLWILHYRDIQAVGF